MRTQLDIDDLDELPRAVVAVPRSGPWRSSPEEVAVSRERQAEYRTKIDIVLAAMPAEQARCLLLVHVVFGHLDQGQVKAAAAETGKTIEATDSLLRRAQRRFRVEWEARFGPLGER